ncbi:hypothetical protein NQ314_002076 [Rhamnusium bicolor]|uniref:HTH CENPB-type domain-containing protein n=1 Tax=Rhamnusium bicolor TaxID=1586634 RepID=A0AAV8ZSH1_9CUCU|nr:hypothetical protein NQ314_002076 [Rhamnusium bicolor]
MDVNDALALGTLSTGTGYSMVNELFSVLNVPFMSPNTYQRHHENVAELIHKLSWATIEKSGKEETELARELGQVDGNGTPFISVIADGAWSKRSYSTNYNAPSGVACIIGARTRKILFLGVRNAYCCICARAEKKGMPIPEHKCFKNWSKTSTSMEADIIVEGFKRSLEMHGIIYSQLIVDGDNSVSRKLFEARPYGNKLVEKIECRNHLLRNFCKKIRDICGGKRSNSKNMPVLPGLRKIVENNVRRLRYSITSAVAYRTQSDASFTDKVSNLCKDLINVCSHVFGEHKNCKELAYFKCSPDKNANNYIPAMRECGLLDDIVVCFNRLVINANSLITNMDINIAEQHNAVVCKFIGGNRVNFSLKESYEACCEAAAVSFNARGDYYTLPDEDYGPDANPKPDLLEEHKVKNLLFAGVTGNDSTQYGQEPETTGKVGKYPVLGEEVENRLVEWIKETSRAGFPICREGLIYSVQKLVKEAELNTPFKNGTPGRKWFQLFMSRHPDLSRKQSEYINRARSLVTEQKIKSWFAETLELLGDDKSVLEDPVRVWNMDETAMYLCPKGTLVLAEKGVPVFNTSANSDKENITTLFTVGAAGHMAPPLTLYKYDRLPKNVSKNAPPEWAIGKSPKEWMTSSAFYEYFANVLLPYLKKTNVKFPSKWKKEVMMFRHENNREIQKGDIPNILTKIMKDLTFDKSIQNGFRVCGLYPFNPNNVNYSKCALKELTHEKQEVLHGKIFGIKKTAMLQEIVGKRQIIAKYVKFTLEKLTETTSSIIGICKLHNTEHNPSINNLCTDNSNIELACTESNELTAVSSSAVSSLQNLLTTTVEESVDSLLPFMPPVGDKSVNNCDIDDDHEDKNSLRNKLRNWALRNNKVPLSAISDLLHVLFPFHPELPVDARTLLRTPVILSANPFKTLDN